MSGLPTLDPEIADLGLALGLLNTGSGGVQLDSTWFSQPIAHLSGVLADDSRRAALVRFADTVLNNSQHVETNGITYVQLFDLRELAGDDALPDLTLQVSLDDRPAAYVEVGLAATLATLSPATTTSVVVPLYRAQKTGQTVPQQFALLAGGQVQLSTDLTLSTTTPATADFGLAGVSLAISSAITDAADPAFTLVLKGLHLPGATTSSDLTIGGGADVEDTLLSLVLGLVRQAADSLSGAQAQAVNAALSLFGLSATPGIPPLPVESLLDEGVPALRTWFVDVMGSTSAQAAWLDALADLLGGTAGPGGVAVPIGAGPVSATLGISAANGPSGHLVVTPSLGLRLAPTPVVGAVQLAVEATIDLLTIDTTSGALSAVPDVTLAVTASGPGGGPTGNLLHTGEIDVAGLRLGLAVHGGVPQALVQALGVTLEGQTHAVLDLSSPDAVVAAAGQVAAALLGQLLDALGDVGADLKALLGLVPTGGTAALDAGLLLTDPLGTLTAWWHDLLTNHAADVADVLTHLRDLVAGPTQATIAVSVTDTTTGPWSIPIADGLVLTVALESGRVVVAPALTLQVDDVAGTGASVVTSLQVRLASLDLAGRHAEFPLAVSLSAAVHGTGETQARLALGPAAVVADSIGLAASWSPAAGLSVGLQAPNLALQSGTTTTPLVLPTLDSAGTVSVPDTAWDSVELLIAAIAAGANQGVLNDLVALFGWQLTGTPPGPKLALADVVANPATAFATWLAALATSADLIATLLTGVAALTSTTDTAVGTSSGSGRPDDPWVVSLGDSSTLPAIAVWMGPDGPVVAPATGDALSEWQAGQPGLAPSDLAQALTSAALADGEVADLAAGRNDVAVGLTTLAGRWVGTDGLVTPPSPVPDGLTSVERPDLDWTSLAALDPADVITGAVPPVVVRVAVCAVADLPWTPAAGRLLDLTQPGVAPDSFSVTGPASGEWVVALASRTDSSLGTTDPSGLAGQAARLSQVLTALATAGEVAIVAFGGAGSAARVAADGVTEVSHLVTLGSPWSAATFDTARTGDSADTLRLLKALLPAVDPHVADSADLAHGRALVTGFFAAARGAVAVSELEATRPDLAIRDGLTAIAVFGVLTDDTVARATTAVFAAGLANLAQAQAAQQAPPTQTFLGVRLPFSFLTPPGGHGTTLAGSVLLTLGSVAATGTTVTPAPSLTVDFTVADTDTWLVGGPGSTPVGAALPLELRRLRGQVSIGLAGGPSNATLTLSEGSALGADWPRLVVDPPTVATGTLDVRPLLPEAQALLAAVTAKLVAAAPSSPAAIVSDLLAAVGVTGSDGALIPNAVAHLLHDPGAQLRAVAADPQTRSLLLSSLSGLITGLTVTGDAVQLVAGPVTVTGDFDARTVGLTATASDGPIAWSVGGTVDASGHVSVSAGLGDPTADPFALTVLSGPARAQLVRAPGLAPVELFPAVDVNGLVGLAAAAVPAEATRVVFEAVRSAQVIVAPLLDALADALGMLKAADAHNIRAYASPIGLFEEPAAWFRHGVLTATVGGGFDTTKLIGLLEALKPFVGLAGTPLGVWPVTGGVEVSVTAGATGPTVALAIDATQWLPSPAAFAAGLSLGLTLPTGTAPQPTVDLYLGVPDGANGTSTPQHRRAAHLVIDGNQLELLLRPTSGADIEIFPNLAGLGALLEEGVLNALPTALTQLAAMSGDDVRNDIAALVGAVGRGLALATGTPAVFDPAALKALAADPGAYLRAQLGGLLTQAGAALDPVLVRALALPPGSHVATLSSVGVLTVSIRTVTLEIHPAPLRLSLSGDVSGLPVVDSVAMTLTVDETGLTGWSAEVGPAAIDLGGPVLRPFGRVSSGAMTGWQVDVGLGLDDTAPAVVGHAELTARWRQASGLGVLVTTRTSATNVAEDASPAGVALGSIDAVLELVGDWVLGITDVQTALEQAVGGHDLRYVLAGSLLTASPQPLALVPDPLGGWPAKLLTMAGQLAGCAPTVDVGPVALGISNDVGVLGVSLNLLSPVPLGSGDTTVTLEVDASWIDPVATPGLVVELLTINGTDFTPTPGIRIDGVGIRLGKASGPLIDAGLRLDTIAVHGFGSVTMGGGSTPELAGGVQLELGGLAVPLGGGGGDNAVAQGVMNDAGGSGSPPRPAFSPAVAVQSHGDGVEVTLSAGSGDGPWYLPIQRAFGPLYIDQIGLGVSYQPGVTPRQLDMISLALSGDVSLLGLTASVENLRFSYQVSKPFFAPASWEVDVDGFAIAADFGPLSLAGGLAKFPLAAPLTGVEYLGMLKISYSVYGLDMFGGYAHPTEPDGEQFASFFAFGVLHAPLGGVPAFFVTGAGIGFGINRDLETPTIDQVNTNPFMVALRATGPTPDPMQQLQDMRAIVPPHQGDFWVAAGISFTSFVLVTGEILVTVQFGDGLDVAVLGLARALLPTEDLTLVSIELALLGRFSSKDGLLLIQAQLTNNSWLLDKSVHLTGGFAFETWWKGPNAGQFVITVGGYHPRFSHDGYPVVPRVGLSWQPADEISVTGETYFALCSEAIMAGLGIHAAAHLGPAHASLDLGGDAIVFFDPFYFDVNVYAEANVGISIDVLFGTIDIDVSLGFDVEVEGPPIYLHGHFSVYGVGIPFAVGSPTDPATLALSATDFAAKYLRDSSDAQVVQAAVLLGAQTAGPSTAAGSGGVGKPPDGSAATPFRVVPEFQLTFVTTAPATSINLASTAGNQGLATANLGLGVAPMYSATLDSTLTVTISSDDSHAFDLTDVRLSARPASAFPKGVWGPAQNPAAKTVPTGDTVNACDGITVDTTLLASYFIGPPPIDYHQIELPLTGRKPLPFVTNRAQTDARVTAAKALRTAAIPLTEGNPDADARFVRAALVMSAAGTGLTTVASLRGDRAAAPTFGSLADDLVDSPDAVSTAVTGVVVDRNPPVVPRFPPLVKSVVGGSLALTLNGPGTTTVASSGAATPVATPTLAGVRAAVAGASQLALNVAPRSAQVIGKTAVAVGTAPITRLASGAVGAVANARPAPGQAARLADMTANLVGAAAPKGLGVDRRRRQSQAVQISGATVHEGELAVITIDGRPAGEAPDTATIVGGATRVLCLAAGGLVLDDVTVGADGAPAVVPLPPTTERVAVIALGTSSAIGGSVAGWYAGQSLPTVGWGAALAGGAVVSAQGSRVQPNRDRADGGWVQGTELTTAGRTTTTFSDAVGAVAVAIEDQAGSDAAAEVSIQLTDATRAVDAAGAVLPPQVLVDGTRSILVYAVTASGPAPRVFVDGAVTGALAGVFGSAEGADALAATLSAQGLPAAVMPPLVGGPGLRRVSIDLSTDPAPPPPQVVSTPATPTAPAPGSPGSPAIRKKAAAKAARPKPPTAKKAARPKKAAGRRTAAKGKTS